MKLMRELRVYLGPEVVETTNSWAGTNARQGTAPFWRLQALVQGPVDSGSGYLCDIKQIDGLLWENVVSKLREGNPQADAGLDALSRVTRDAFLDSARSCPPPAVLSWLRVCISPFTSLAVRRGDPNMICLTQSFEFSAAHRLSCPGFTEAENRRVFGKCSNPNGHGHNYVLEVTMGGAVDSTRGTIVDLPWLDRIVRERVIEPFDHRNLNLECPEFAALNPSVENIARVIWNRLRDGFDRGRLLSVRVWETPKTYAEYSGEET